METWEHSVQLCHDAYQIKTIVEIQSNALEEGATAIYADKDTAYKDAGHV